MTTMTPDQTRLATEIAQLWPPQGQWTETEYFNLPETNRIIELSEGEIFLMAPPGDRHQKVLANLYRVFYLFITEHDSGVVRFAPLAVRLWPGKIREPDLLFVSHKNAHKMGERYYEPPDLVAEVISPGTRRTDRRDKFNEYAQAGIAEYWIVDPEHETIEVYVLDEEVYMLLVKAARGEKAHSAILSGFEVACAEVFA